MINRIKEWQEEPEEREPESDYWEVGGDAGWYLVTRETAEALIRQLRRLRPPRWLRFEDLFGSEVLVLSRGVDHVCECSEGQRSAERRFRRARKQEEKADRRPWEDDD